MKIPINIKSGEIKKDEEIIVGIDLGTTHSLVAYMKEGSPITVKDRKNKNALVPSIVHFDSDGNIVVGEPAKEKLIDSPENTIYSVKRLLGKSYGDLQDTHTVLGYRIIETDDDSLVKVEVNGKYYTPIELSAEILKELKRKIELELNNSISKVVITVPAYFNDSQRQATRDAGKLAGLDVMRIVNEPTAASLAYGIGLDDSGSRKIAVYDLGGGTFDISILEITDGIFDVLSTNGNTFLGGDDFDRRILDYWVEEHGFENTELSFFQELRLLAESAKKELSSQEQFHAEFRNKKLKISKTKFNELIKDLVDETIDSCKHALNDSKLNIDEIDYVILVGGSTRVEVVRKAVGDFFGKQPNDKLNPDEVVALGAAIQADILAGNNKDMLLLDVTPLSLGIETVGGLMDTIIARNTKIPIKAGRQYTTSVDGQKNLKVSVYQGERDLVSDNRKLGEFILRNIPPMAAGIPKIEVTFQLDADGILKVIAKELRSNTVQEVEIKSAYGISEEDMARMLLESIKNAEQDMKVRSLKEAVNEANNLVQSSNKFLIQNKGILSTDEINLINKYISDLETLIEKGNKDEIQSAMDELNTYTLPIAERAMDHNVGKALSGKKI